jgi:hypothetical protein
MDIVSTPWITRQLELGSLPAQPQNMDITEPKPPDTWTRVSYKRTRPISEEYHREAKQTKEKAFRHFNEKLKVPLKTEENIEAAVNYFNETIQLAG